MLRWLLFSILLAALQTMMLSVPPMSTMIENHLSRWYPFGLLKVNRILSGAHESLIVTGSLRAGVFELIDRHPCKKGLELATMPEAKLFEVCDALSALGLMRRCEVGFELTTVAKVHLTRSMDGAPNPEFVGGMGIVANSPVVIRKLLELGSAPVQTSDGPWAISALEADDLWSEFAKESEVYMQPFSESVARLMVGRVPAADVDILDVGAGSGIFSNKLCSSLGNRCRSVVMYDLPSTIAAIRKRFASAEKVTLVAGDALSDNATGVLRGLTFDCIMMNSFLQHFSDGEAKQVVAKFLPLLSGAPNNPQRQMTIVEMTKPDASEISFLNAPWVFSVVLASFTKSGRVRSRGEFRRLLAEFGRVEEESLFPMPASIFHLHPSRV